MIGLFSMRCRAGDGGAGRLFVRWPSVVTLQEEATNHPKVLRSRAVGAERWGKRRACERVGYDPMKANESSASLCCVQLAGGSPVTVMSKQRCSWWPAWGEILCVEASRQRSFWGRASKRSVTLSESCLAVIAPASAGHRGSRAAYFPVKAMDGVKVLELQPQRTLRRMGNGTFAQLNTEEERSVCAPALDGRGLASLRCPVKGEADKCSPRKRSSAQRKSAQVVVTMMGTDNITCPSEGPVAGCVAGVLSISGDEGLRSPTRRGSYELRSETQITRMTRQRPGKAECGSSTVQGNAVCGKTARTVWEGAGGTALMMPSPSGSLGGTSVARLSLTSQPQMKCRNALDDIKSGQCTCARDEPGGSLLIGQVVSGMHAARAWVRLLYGTWEPVVSRDGRPVVCDLRLIGHGRTPSGRNREDMRTDARHRGGPSGSSDEGPVMGLERSGRAVQMRLLVNHEVCGMS